MLSKTETSINQNHKVLIDFVNIVNKRVSHLTKYIYFSENIDWYGKLQNHKEYYLTKKEQELVKTLATNKQIAKKFSSYNINHVLEIGPGTEQSLKIKTIPLLNIIKPKLYTAIDLQPEYAAQAAQHVKSTTEIPSNTLISDAFQNLKVPQLHNNTCTLLLGSTIGNLFPNEFHMFLTNLGRELKEGDFFIFSFDSNQDLTNIQKAYSNICARELAFVPMRFFKHHLNIQNFDSEAFDFKFHWINNAVKLMLSAKANQSFVMQGKPVTIKHGDNFCTLFSKKFSLPEMVFAIEMFGLQLIDVFSTPNNPFILTVFQKKELPANKKSKKLVLQNQNLIV